MMALLWRSGRQIISSAQARIEPARLQLAQFDDLRFHLEAMAAGNAMNAQARLFFGEDMAGLAAFFR